MLHHNSKNIEAGIGCQYNHGTYVGLGARWLRSLLMRESMYDLLGWRCELKTLCRVCATVLCLSSLEEA